MTVERIEAIPVRIGFRGAFATSRGTVGAADEGALHVLVKATAADGSVGWGEARPSRHWSDETPETVVTTIRRYFAPALAGHDVFDQRGLAARLDAEIAPGFTTGQPIARSGVEVALWDLAGQAAGVPLRALLGGGGAAITLSWTVTGHDPESAAASVSEGRSRGYRHFNFKLGFGLQRDLAVARAIAEAAPEAFLWADANGGYGFDDAVQAARRLPELGVDVFEQPLPPNRYTDYPALRRRAGLPIAVDEGVCSPTDLIQLVRLDAVDAFTVKIARMGGLGPARRAIDVAQASGLRVLGSGLTESDLLLAAYAHLLSAAGVDTPCALNGRQFLAEHPVADLGGEGDGVPVPTAPGLGVRVDEAWVDAHRVELP